MTIRLYHRDAYLREFEAEVTAVHKAGDGAAVVLSQTAFYPHAGGQPCDLGVLAGRTLRDVREETGEIWHVLDGDPPAAGARVTGTIDWPRRFDHMQHHTGQHILSQAFLSVLGAQTTSVHMGTACTIDLATASLDADGAGRAEDLANAIVMENRPVIIREVDDAEAATLGLRRPPKQTGPIRVVEVLDFDRSACGGTHVRHSGEVGPIVIRGWDRYKGGVRVEFLSGLRALRDYRATRDLVRDLAAGFSVGAPELPDVVARLRERARDLERQLGGARTLLLDQEAAVLLAGAGGSGGNPVLVTRAFTGRPIEELRALARALTGRAACVAVLATDPDRRIIVARSQGLALDAGAILKEALAAFGGRGGGRPEAAEGAATSAPSAAALVEAVRVAAMRHLPQAGA